MVNNHCPACGEPIATDDLNMKEGVGLCRACGKLSRLSEIAEVPAVDMTAVSATPTGCSYAEPMEGGKVIRASLRSLSGAAGLLFACLFWNGIVSIFLLVTAGALYTNLVGPLPKWFPAPQSSSSHSSHAEPTPLSVTIFMCLFLTPFVVIGVAIFTSMLQCLFGQIEITVMGSDGRVRTGFGPFNWTRRFDASRVTRVVAGLATYSQNSYRNPVIQIVADRTIKFGSLLPDERRTWMLGTLQQLSLAPRKTRQPVAALAK